MEISSSFIAEKANSWCSSVFVSCCRSQSRPINVEKYYEKIKYKIKKGIKYKQKNYKILWISKEAPKATDFSK